MLVKRFCHRLREGAQTSAPSTFIVFDTETHIERFSDGSESHTLRLGWACCWSRERSKRPEVVEWFPFTEAGVFWDWVEARLEPAHRNFVIAHSVVFDFVQVGGFEMTEKRGYDQDIIYSKGGTSIIGFRVGKIRMLLLDSMNYCRVPLAVVGELVGVPKMTVDFRTVGDDELSVYCRNDTLILLRFIQGYVQFILDHDLGKMRFTISSQAMEAYRHRLMPFPIMIHDNERVTELERGCYYGGRVEAWQIGTPPKGEYYCVDINSMYPYVMRSNPFPYRLRGMLSNLKPDDIRGAIEREDCVALCDIETDEPVYPFRYEHRLTFPVGSFMTGLTTPEVKYALEHGHLRRVHLLACYKRAWLFRDWVDAMYELRRRVQDDGNKVYTKMVKLLLNSLYGKFGQRVEDWERVEPGMPLPDGSHEEFSPETGEYKRMMIVAGRTWMMSGVHESGNSFPAIAGHVTAYARLYLWELIRQAGFGHVYYMDTDSLIVDRAGYENLSDRMHETELGRLKLERVSSKLVIHGLKDYRHGESLKIKGIRKKAVRLREGVYEQDRWPGLPGLIASGRTDRYIVKRVRKHLSRKYTKGMVSSSGRVHPLRFDGGALVDRSRWDGQDVF